MKVNVLIVDDEPDVEFMFKQKFRNEIKSAELDLRFALSAKSALEYLNTLKPFDILLVLSDVNMPEMNGFDLLKEIKQTYPLLRVFMVTAYGDKYSHQEALRMGAHAFFTKPVDFPMLKQRIAELTEEGYGL